ncbi:hypothetical protein RUND412_005997 [Rhizina undulata]
MADADMDIDEVPPSTEDSHEDGPEGTKGPAPKTGAGAIAVRSIEGWIVLVTNVHEEASEEDLQERFGEYGDIQNMHLNLDRRTGYVKGYALIEFSTLAEAREAIAQTNGTKLLDQTIYADFAFVRPPPGHQSNNRGGAGGFRRGGGGGGGRGTGRPRSRSPGGRNGGDEVDESAPRSLEERIE